MPVAVTTRFTTSSSRQLPRFLGGTVAAALQARRSRGFLAGQLRIDPHGAYWTLTLWESGRDMAGFRDSGIHAVLVPKLAGWADEAVFGVWNTPDRVLPPWQEVQQRVAEHPNFAPLDNPNAAHLAHRFQTSARDGLVLSIPRSLKPRVLPQHG